MSGDFWSSCDNLCGSQKCSLSGPRRFLSSGEALECFSKATVGQLWAAVVAAARMQLGLPNEATRLAPLVPACYFRTPIIVKRSGLFCEAHRYKDDGSDFLRSVLDAVQAK